MRQAPQQINIRTTAKNVMAAFLVSIAAMKYVNNDSDTITNDK